MRRIQLYFDDELWNVLRARARNDGTTIAELVRVAARERYLGSIDARRLAMQAVVGIRKDCKVTRDTLAYVRGLRRGVMGRTIA